MAKKRNLKTSLVMSLFLLAIVSTAGAEIIYVDADASTGGNGQTWATAYKYLQDALYKPATSGDQIWVAEGTYRPDDDDASNAWTVLENDTIAPTDGNSGNNDTDGWDVAPSHMTLLSPPSPPTNVQASDGTYTGYVRITWNSSTGATQYKVYRATSSTGAKTLLTTTSSTSYNDTGATPGTTYYYWVKAKNTDGESDYSSYNTGWRKLSAPTNVSASDGTYTGYVRVTWTKPTGASHCQVYRATSSTGTKTALGTWTTGTSYNDTTATPGVTYYYFVRAATNSTGARPSDYSSYNTGWRKLSAPTVSASDGTYTGYVQVTCSSVSGASYYRFYRATSSTGTKTAITGWQTSTSHNDTGATPGVTYYYFARAATSSGGSRPSDYSSYDIGWRPSDTIAPTADIADVTPDPRLDPVDEVSIVFSEAVTGFDLSDLTLTRDGGGNLLPGGASLSTGDNITWTLSNLSGLTEVPGTYSLTLTAAGSGIEDLAGNPLGGDASDTWTVLELVPGPILVDADATGANNGLSWADAYNFLQDALAEANSNPDVNEIWVAEGTYKPDANTANPGSGDRTATFQLINSVGLYGGYAGYGAADPNERDVDGYETILSGDLDGNDVQVSDPCDLLTEPTRAYNSYHVVTCTGRNVTALLAGFTITAGNANGPDPQCYGGGMCNYWGSSPTLSNCTFSGNTAIAYGGGMYNSLSSHPTLTNCILWSDSAPSGPEIFNINSTPSVTYSDIACGYTGTGNIATDPLFIGPNGLDGIPGTADDEDDNVHLRGYSPCINAGDPGGDYSGQVDIDRQPRVAYGRVDMGADEVFPIAGDFEPDGDVDFVDFARFANHWLLGH